MTLPLDALEWRKVWEAIAETVAESIPEEDRHAPEEFGIPGPVIERIRLDLLDGDPVRQRARIDRLAGELRIRGFSIVRGER